MIRRYQDADFEDVKFLNSICYARPCSDCELRDRLRGPSWVITDGPVVGCIITCPDADKVLIWSVTVAPSYRRRSLASQLLSEVEKHYGQEIYLHVDVNNAAQKLYFDCGYRCRAFLKNYYGDSDALEMYKPRKQAC